MPRTPAAPTAPATSIPRPGGAARAKPPQPAPKRAAPAPASPPVRRRDAQAAPARRRSAAGARGASSSSVANGAAAGAQKLAANGAAAGARKSAQGTSPGEPAAAARKAAGRAAAPLRIERKTVAMLALERLRERILHGDYPEGAPLRQDALAAELGVSRIPVREALRQLEAEGLVTFSPHVGAVVSSLSLEEIRELFDLRALLESELLRRAIPHMHEDDLARAAGVLAEYRAAFRRRDVAAWGALNWEFHAALLQPAAQPLTMAILQNLHNQSDRYTRLQLALTHGEDRAREEHSAILEAVRDYEAQRACALLASHILGAGRSLLEFLRADRGLSAGSDE